MDRSGGPEHQLADHRGIVIGRQRRFDDVGQQTAEDLVNPRPTTPGAAAATTVEFPTLPAVGVAPQLPAMPGIPGAAPRMVQRAPGSSRNPGPATPASDVEIADLFRSRAGGTNTAAPPAPTGTPAPR